ncbi:MAG: hypothetical protein WHV67_10260 [Thermoanaerobaculia bacterium]
MKKIFFIVILVFSMVVFGQNCVNYSVNYNCNSNQTLLNMDNGNLSFTALAKWELNKIEYTVKRGPEILRIDVKKESDYLVFEAIYHNKFARLKLDPSDGKFSTENAIEFLNFINSLGTGFLGDVKNLLGESNCSTYSNSIIELYNYLTNPAIVRYAIGGRIGIVLGDSFGYWSCYAACYWDCMAGCMSQGYSFEECSEECAPYCRNWCREGS